MNAIDDRAVAAQALINGVLLTNADIRDLELARARHALAYLKQKLGNAAMLELIKDDLAQTVEQARRWLAASSGGWQTAFVELTVPGPSAAAFHLWYSHTIQDSACEPELRAGHPEHFVSHPHVDGIEVVENVGETELPWRILYRPLQDDGGFPMPWSPDYSAHFGAELVMDGVRVGFTMHQLRDVDGHLEMKLSTFLPTAAPRELVARHLHHFTIEFRNWSIQAWRDASLSSANGVQSSS